MNAYEILECGRDASPDELKRSYHQLLLKHHPDKQAHSSSSIDTFLRIQWAYRLLSDRTQKLAYDSLLTQVDLKQKADETSSALGLLSLREDFDLEENGRYKRACRCGSEYVIAEEMVTTILKEFFEHSEKKDLKESLVVCLECDTCSLTLNVLLI